ncbi:MAG: histidine kinase [Pyrinomonadaceae bacterium]
MEINHNSEHTVSDPRVRRKQFWLIFFLVFVFWTLIGAIAAVQEYIAVETRGEPVVFVNIVVSNLPIYFWALSTPLIFWLGQKYSLSDRDRWGSVFPIHLIMSMIFAAVYLLIVSVVTRSINCDCEQLTYDLIWSYYKYRFGRGFHVSVLTYWAVLGFGFALDFSKRLQLREFQSAKTELELETKLVQANLDALKMQLHPHFLFNTLNTVSAIMSDDPKGARRVIARLSELLRINLETTNQQTISLRRELDLLDLYLDIESERFRDQLEVNVDVPSVLWECQVPHFILQPLVENAIKHGIANTKKKGLISISAARKDAFLEIVIRDNGIGFTENSKQGIGLGNTEERLKKLYGSDFRFEITGAEDGGTRVLLRIPHRTIAEGSHDQR